MSPIWQSYLMLAAAVVSTGCAVFVAWRSARWRDNDELKAMIASAAADWAKSDAAKELHDRVDACESRLDKFETSLNAMPTKADLAKVEGELHGLQTLMGNVERAIRRIEGYMMERRP